MNYNREPDQCPRELLSRWVELTEMLYFKQGNREQVQVELNGLMSQARHMGLFKESTTRSEQNRETGGADRDTSSADAIRARGLGIRLDD